MGMKIKAKAAKRGRPKNRIEEKQRKAEHRAALAAKHKIARSLRPNEWLQHACIEGDVEALAIRDAWAFIPSNTILVTPERWEEKERARESADVYRNRQPVHREDVESRTAQMEQAHAFALRMAAKNEVLCKAQDGAEEIKDAAQGFTLKIWKELISGAYQETGKFQHWLGTMWGLHLKDTRRALLNRRDDFHSLPVSEEQDDEGTQEPVSVVNRWTQTAQQQDQEERENMALRKRLNAEFARLDQDNQSTWQLIVKLGGEPTVAELAKAMGCSQKTAQRRRDNLRRAAANHGAEVMDISAHADFRIGEEDAGELDIYGCADPDYTRGQTECVGRLSAASASEPAERIMYDRKGAALQLSISVRALDYLIAGKRIATRRIGKKIMVTRTELLRFSRSDHPEPVMEDAA